MQEKFYLSVPRLSKSDIREIEEMITLASGDVEKFQEFFRTRFRFLPDVINQSEVDTFRAKGIDEGFIPIN